MLLLLLQGQVAGEEDAGAGGECGDQAVLLEAPLSCSDHGGGQGPQGQGVSCQQEGRQPSSSSVAVHEPSNSSVAVHENGLPPSASPSTPALPPTLPPHHASDDRVDAEEEEEEGFFEYQVSLGF